MRRGLLLVIMLIAAGLVPAASGTLDVYVSPENVSAGEQFITYVKITDSVPSIITAEATTLATSEYNFNPQTMQTLNAKYARFHGSSNYWISPSDYVARPLNYVNVSADYLDTGTALNVQENSSAKFNIGKLYVNLTNSDFYLTKKVGENVSLDAFVTDEYNNLAPSSGIKYVVRDLKTMAAIQAITPLESCMPMLCANYTITSANPAGVISLYASNGTDLGGRNIIFAAIPYNISPVINNSFPAVGDSVSVLLNLENIYGQILGVSTTITYPNGTQISAPTFAAPNMSGDYVLNAVVSHSIRGDTSHGAVFRIQTAYLYAATDKTTYKQGENVTVNAAVYDSNGTSLPSNMNITIFTPSGATFSYYDGSISSFGNLRMFVYETLANASVGAYNMTLSASDEYGRKYYKEGAFTINALNKTLVASPSSILAAFANMNNITYTINLSSNSTATISSIQVTLGATISQYSVLNLTLLQASLSPGGKTSFTVTVIPNTTISSSIDGNIVVTFDSNTLSIPLTIRNSLAPSIDIAPSYSAEIIAGKDKRVAIDIKNNGTGTMTGLNMTPDSNLSSYIDNIVLPASIAAGATATAYFDLNVPSSGKYAGTIRFAAPAANSYPVALSAESFDDFYGAISDMDSLRKSLNTRSLAFEASGNDVTSVSSEITALQGEISNLKSLYDNGQYSQAKSKLLLLQADANKIQASLDALETAAATVSGESKLDGVCEETESCSSADCAGDKRCDVSTGGSGIGTIIIVVILVVIIAFVLATSIMPDEKGSAAAQI